jgi:GT2 family glycosyltransferase
MVVRLVRLPLRQSGQITLPPDAMSRIEIPVVLVTWNAAKHFDPWFKSIRRLARPFAKPVPFVVDNGSDDATPGKIWGAIKSGWLRKKNVIWLPQNFGMSKAQNIAFRTLGGRGKYEVIATLNQDAIANVNWLDELAHAVLKRADGIGMWGGPIFDATRQTCVSSAGHCLRARDGAFLDIDRKQELGSSLHHTSVDFEPFSPCFAAACWSTRMLEKIGLPDNEQFLYYDDVELAWKARLSGFRAEFVAGAIAYHPIPQSKPSGSRFWTSQQEGRLALIARYFPDDERERVLQNLTSTEHEVFSHLERTRNLRPYMSDVERRKVFFEWTNKYCERA